MPFYKIYSLKRKFMYRQWMVFLCSIFALHNANAQRNFSEQQVRNITSFCRLYGYIRYFHPADEARKIDWERFSIYGCRKVLGSVNNIELIEELKRLYLPLAPSLKIFTSDDSIEFDRSSIIPADTQGFKVISWQHLGLGTSFSEEMYPYFFSSIRLNRPAVSAVATKNYGTVNSAPLFPHKAEIGAHIKKELVDGIFCIVPIALYGKSNFTYPLGDSVSLKNLVDVSFRTTNINLTADSLDVRLGNLVVAWNVYRHFFPFWSEASILPEKLLHDAIIKSFTDKTPFEFLQTLQLMCAPLNDGHIFVLYDKDSSNASSAPIVFARVENRIVIKQVLDSSLRQIRSGDVVDSINGRSALELLNEIKRYISGSPQWKDYKGLVLLANGPPNSNLHLTISKEGVREKVIIARNRPGVEYRNGLTAGREMPSGEIRKGIYYVNLLDSVDRFTPLIGKLMHAKAVVFDFRGYPSVDYFSILLGHLMSGKSRDRFILHGPQIIYPDYQRVTYKQYNTIIDPTSPHLKTRLYFLSDASAASYSENFLGYIRDFKIGTLVGQPTAGTNGNINGFYLPGGYQMYFTGMLVTNQCGNGSHLQGITPDVVVNPTIAGITMEKDEILEKAIKLAENDTY